MGHAIARTCKRAWAGAARPAFIVALLVLVPLGAVLIHSVLRATPVTVNIITVNTNADPGPTADCDLRDAITAANNKTATNGCVAGTGDDAIHFNIGSPATITLGSALPAIANTSPNTLTIDGTGQSITIDGDSTYQIFSVNSGATLTLNDLTLADGNGGGGSGGAINNSGTLTVTNSTFSNNSAPGPPGVYGGAIYSTLSLTVTNSTFSGNSAGGLGGAINSNAATITNSTFSGNSASVGDSVVGGATVSNSILSASSGTNCDGTITDDGYNISYNSSGSDTSCGFSGTGANGDTLGDNVNPLLAIAGLANNGGPTDTIALQGNGPAIAAIPSASCTATTTDQRGDPRPAPGKTACDIGAYESQIAEVGTDQAAATSTSSCAASSFNFASRDVVAGSMLALEIGTGGYSGEPGITTPTDDNGGSWTCTIAQEGDDDSGVCIAPNHPGGPTVVTVNYTAGEYDCGVAADLSEWTGMGNPVTVDQTQNNYGYGSSVSTGATATTSQASELALAVASLNNLSETLSSGPSGGFAGLTVEGAADNDVTIFPAFQVLSSTGAVGAG
jgi:predicted outer membrane repeat protein